MKFLQWLKSLGHPGDVLEENSFVPLLMQDGSEAGAVIVHSSETKEALLKSLDSSTEDGFCVHDGSVSSLLFDQLAGTASIVNATVQAGHLLQVAGTPQLLHGIRNGTLSIMQVSGQMTGSVVSQASKRIVGQLRFLPASSVPIMAPIVAWQILHAVAGVSQLQKINARLDSLQRGIERLTFRQQARTLGQLAAAVATLEDLSEQFRASGSFSNDMIVRLALADRDIQSALAEQRFLVQRFDELASRLVRDTSGKEGAVKANQILKEEATEFLLDAKILTTASKASLLSSQAWLRHDLEHNPRNVGRRLKDLEQEIEGTRDIVNPLMALDELAGHAKKCIEEMNWFQKRIFNCSLAKEIHMRTSATEAPIEIDHVASSPNVLVWKGSNNSIRSVVIESTVD